MDLTKKYYDSDGVELSILGVVVREPEWAANRIQDGEKYHAELRKLRGKYCPPCPLCRVVKDPDPNVRFCFHCGRKL